MKIHSKIFQVIRFHPKVWLTLNGFIRVYDGTRYLVLFRTEKYDLICNRIRYLLRVKTGITNLISHNYAKIKVDSYNSLLPEKATTFHNVIILINSVQKKDQNHYYYNMFLEKALNNVSSCIN